MLKAVLSFLLCSPEDMFLDFGKKKGEREKDREKKNTH